jgi:D-alanyl-D-alanine carboxypeptidase (penicillin-binding protein 5/6)
MQNKIKRYLIQKNFLLVLNIFILSALLSNNSFADNNDSLKSCIQPFFYKDEINGLVGDEQEIRAGLLYDLTRNVIVWEKDMDYAYPIASLTKMMVGLLAIEDIEAGRVSWDDKISVTRIYKQKKSRRKYITYKSEETYSFRDLLKMAMVASHNESTVWIAEHCSGSVTAFVDRMNQKALELGMSKTMYTNTSGLPANISELDNSSSAKDMLVLGLEVLKHDQLMEITAIPTMNIYNGKGMLNFHNHNGLVITYNKEVDGIKTGFTRAAGFCLVSTATRGGHRLMSVVFGVRSPWVRNGLVASMMNSYYDAMRLGRLGESEIDMKTACAFLDSVNGGLVCVKPNIEPRHKDASDESYAYTFKTEFVKTKKSVIVRKGDQLGKIADRYDVSVADIKKWNKLKGTTVHPGQNLAIYKTVKKKVPVQLVVEPDESYADNQSLPENNNLTETEINVDQTITQSDSEKSIVATPVNEKVKENNTIHASTAKKQVAKPTSSKVEFIYHTVQPGDTLWNIAQRYQANINQIKKVNRISNSKNLKSGSRIKIPVNNKG